MIDSKSTEIRERIATSNIYPYAPAAAGGFFNIKLEYLEKDAALGVADRFGEALLGQPNLGRTMALRSLYEQASASETFFQQVWPRGSHTVRMPLVWGVGRQPDVRVPQRQIFCATLSDALVTGRSGMIRIGNSVVVDYFDDELKDWPVDFRFDPIIFAHTDDEAVVVGAGDDAPEISEAISLLGCTSFAFGHWISEYIPKYLIFKKIGAPDGIPILIDADLPPQQREAMASYTQGRHPIIEVAGFSSVRVHKLWVVSTLGFVPILPKPGTPIGLNHISPPADFVADLFRDIAGTLPTIPFGGSRLYLARKPSLHRRLINHEEITDICKSRGFEIVYPEEHSFERQLSLIRIADYIVGPDGSALLMAVHARPGTKLLIMNHPFLENLPTLTHILEEIGLDVQILEGECTRYDPSYRKFSDYRIEPTSLTAILDS